jgi:hypothetical protein
MCGDHLSIIANVVKQSGLNNLQYFPGCHVAMLLVMTRRIFSFLRYLNVLLFLLVSFGCQTVQAEKTASSSGTVETYWEVPALIIPVVKGDEVYAYVRVLVQVMTQDATSIYWYKVYEPILQSRFFEDIYGALCDQWLPGKEPNQDTIQRRLQAITDRLVGPGKLSAHVVNFYFYKPQKKVNSY